MAEKELHEMTLEELWSLFPITLSPHREEWRDWAEEEIARLDDILKVYKPIISHIGSTSVQGILSKPTVDILVEMPPELEWRYVIETIQSNGYLKMAESEKRVSFNKGYTPKGYSSRVFHIHFHRYGDNDEICFRDYLRANPLVAKEYERLKSSLLPEFRHNRDGYTEAKTSFVNAIVKLAKTGNI